MASKRGGSRIISRCRGARISTCAACSARVEKTTSGVVGVEHVVVNLLKNSMEVEYDGNPATLAAISAAVEKAG